MNKKMTVILLIAVMITCLCSCRQGLGENGENETTLADGSAAETMMGESSGSTQEEQTAGQTEETTGPSGYRSGSYVTYTLDDAVFLESIKDAKAYGSETSCTSMQGMAASDHYIYVAKQQNDETAIFVQYDPENDTQKNLTYYNSLEASEESTLDSLGHCNDMTVFTDADGEQYILASRLSKTLCLTRLKLDEEEGVIRLTGYFNLIGLNDSGETVNRNSSAVRFVAQTNEYNYFLMKTGDNFHWFKIAVNSTGGTSDAPEDIFCVKLFAIDNSNLTCATEDGQTETVKGLEDWTNQGYFYSAEEELIYVPVFNSTSARENYILVFNVSGMLTIDALEKATSNQSTVLTPSNLSFNLSSGYLPLFEVESCVFLKNQGTDGDLSLYFNTNSNLVSSYEGIWQLNYTRGSVEVE